MTVKMANIPQRLQDIPKDFEVPVSKAANGDLEYIRFLGDPKWHMLTRLQQWNACEGAQERYEDSVELLRDGVHKDGLARLEIFLEDAGGDAVTALVLTVAEYWQTGVNPEEADKKEEDGEDPLPESDSSDS